MNAARAVSRAWSWRHAVTRSGMAPTTRHVLLTLSVFMDGAGQSCFPSIEDLVEATGLSKRSILTHITAACDAGWLRRKLHGFRGQKWKRLEYEPGWPGRDVEGGEPAAPPSEEEAVNVVHEGGEPPASEAVNVVHQDRDHSIHHSNTTPPDERDAHARGGEDHVPDRPLLDKAKALHPTTAHDSQAEIDREWIVLTREDRRAAVDGLPAWLAEKGHRKAIAGLPVYFREKRWSLVKSRIAAATGGGPPDAAPAFDRIWSACWLDYVAWAGDRLLDRHSVESSQLAIRVSAARKFSGPWKFTSPAMRERVEALAATLVQVDKASDAAEAWARHYRALGVDLPMPDAAQFIFMPSPWPPDRSSTDPPALADIDHAMTG